MNATKTTNEQHKQTAMLLDLALGNGGKANKALRGTAPALIHAVFSGAVDATVIEAAKALNTKGSSPEIVNLFESLLKTL